MQKLLVEFLGTLALTYVVLATGNPYAIGVTVILAIMVGGAISGGLFNPAVTVGMWMARKVSQADLLPYILAQVLGGVVGLEVFRRFGKLSL
jgi:aquaporin Z